MGGGSSLGADRIGPERTRKQARHTRARKAGVIDPVTGEIVPFPRIPKVPAVEWRRLSPAEKVERLIGLDRAYQILSWPTDWSDPVIAAYKWQVSRVILPIDIKATLNGSRGR